MEPTPALLPGLFPVSPPTPARPPGLACASHLWFCLVPPVLLLFCSRASEALLLSLAEKRGILFILFISFATLMHMPPAFHDRCERALDTPRLCVSLAFQVS